MRCRKTAHDCCPTHGSAWWLGCWQIVYPVVGSHARARVLPRVAIPQHARYCLTSGVAFGIRSLARRRELVSGDPVPNIVSMQGQNRVFFLRTFWMRLEFAVSNVEQHRKSLLADRLQIEGIDRRTTFGNR